VSHVIRYALYLIRARHSKPIVFSRSRTGRRLASKVVGIRAFINSVDVTNGRTFVRRNVAVLPEKKIRRRNFVNHGNSIVNVPHGTFGRLPPNDPSAFWPGENRTVVLNVRENIERRRTSLEWSCSVGPTHIRRFRKRRGGLSCQTVLTVISTVR